MSLLEDILSKDPTFVLNSQYKSIRKLSIGSFSDIFTAESIGKQTSVIIKAPHKTALSYAEISKEALILLKLKESTHVPKVLYLQADKRCEALVLEKLGASLEALKQDYNNFSLQTTILLAWQLLGILEEIHKNGILHRDIKPSNVLVGEGNNQNKVYLIDFDIAANMNLTGSNGPVSVPEFIGTKAFASRNAHKCGQFSRKDDLESLGFTLIYLYQGKLPWTSCKCDILSLGLVKEKFMRGGLLDELPKEFRSYFEYVERLKPEEVPDYRYMKGLFASMGDRFGYQIEKSAFEWVEEEKPAATPCIEEKKEEEFDLKETEEGMISDDSTSESSIQKKVFSLNLMSKNTVNPVGFGRPNRIRSSSSFMQGFKEVFLKGQGKE